MSLPFTGKRRCSVMSVFSQVLGVSLSAALTQSILTKKLTEGIKGHHAREVSGLDTLTLHPVC